MTQLAFSDCWYWFLLAAVVCYFIGCFNFAVFISRFLKRDIRNVGSGNPGTMNMTRTYGLKIGAINFFCDVIKGGVPVLCAHFIFKNYVFADTNVLVSDFARYFFGCFVIIGHVFPVSMKFKGGKGIASTLGLFLFSMPCEKWWYVFICIGLFICTLSYIAIFKWGSMGSLFGVTAFSIWQAAEFYLEYSDCLLNGYVISVFMFLLFLNVITWARHSVNIYNLFAGEERKTLDKKRK